MQFYPSLKVRLNILFVVVALVPLTVFGWVLLGDHRALQDDLRSHELELEWARLERSLRQRLTSLVRRCREARPDRNQEGPTSGGPDLGRSIPPAEAEAA